MLFKCALMLFAVLAFASCTRLVFAASEHDSCVHCQEELFLTAAKGNNYEKVLSLINQVGTDTRGEALVLAATIGNVETLSAILSSGSYIHTDDVNRALCYAALTDRAETVKSLLSSKFAFDWDAKASALFGTAALGHAATFKYIISISRDAVLNSGAVDVSLIEAARNNRQEIVKLLVAGGFHLTKYAKYQAILESAIEDHQQITNLLLGLFSTEFADGSFVKDYALIQEEALIEAAKNDRTSMVGYIMVKQGPSLAAKSRAFIHAASNGHLRTINFLASNLETVIGDTLAVALTNAILAGHTKVAQYIKELLGSDADD